MWACCANGHVLEDTGVAHEGDLNCDLSSTLTLLSSGAMLISEHKNRKCCLFLHTKIRLCEKIYGVSILRDQCHYFFDQESNNLLLYFSVEFNFLKTKEKHTLSYVQS